jgi:hypothetical protein
MGYKREGYRASDLPGQGIRQAESATNIPTCKFLHALPIPSIMHDCCSFNQALSSSYSPCVHFLQVGLPGSKDLSVYQQQAHFTLWSIMKSPLIIGADMSKLTPKQIAILQNPEIIALNQDRLGIPGDLIWKEGAEEVVPASHTAHCQHC